MVSRGRETLGPVHDGILILPIVEGMELNWLTRVCTEA